MSSINTTIATVLEQAGMLNCLDDTLRVYALKDEAVGANITDDVFCAWLGDVVHQREVADLPEYHWLNGALAGVINS